MTTIKLIPHNHASETFVCRDCMVNIDPVTEEVDGTTCPHCGGEDTAWMFAPDYTATVYVVRDASGEYLRADGSRTPAGDEAHEFEHHGDAVVACERATDKVLARQV